MRAVPTILHADLDAFYASVEQLLDPSLRGKPIAVGGGVVLAASYEAKGFGVRGGMSGWQARQLCPQLRFVSGHFGEYQRLGDAAIGIVGDYTPLVERVSIDEAFADVAGSIRLFGPPQEIARTIRRRVKHELGLSISVGLARSKHLAKIASQVAKPDGLVVVDPETELEFLHDLPVELMWGVGPVTAARLADIDVRTIGQLAVLPASRLEALVGHAVGTKLSSLAWNRDAREIRTHHRARSAGGVPGSGSRDGLPIGRSMQFAIASVGMQSAMAALCLGSHAPFPTNSVNSPRKSCEASHRFVQICGGNTHSGDAVPRNRSSHCLTGDDDEPMRLERSKHRIAKESRTS
jgi:DNA polymerase IV